MAATINFMTLLRKPKNLLMFSVTVAGTMIVINTILKRLPVPPALADAIKNGL